MSQQTFTLHLSEDVLKRLRETAKAVNRPIEDVITDSIEVMFSSPESAISPEELVDFSDAELWGVVHRRLATSVQTRLEELAALGRVHALSPDEEQERDHLMEAYDRYVLLRSHALLLLKQRGHDVDRWLRAQTY